LGAKPFNKNYHAHTTTGSVLINGEQVVKIETIKKGENWDVVFHLSDGTTHTVLANRWTKKFVTDMTADLNPYPESNE